MSPLTELAWSYPALLLTGYALPIAFFVGILRTRLARSAVVDVIRVIRSPLSSGVTALG